MKKYLPIVILFFALPNICLGFFADINSNVYLNSEPATSHQYEFQIGNNFDSPISVNISAVNARTNPQGFTYYQESDRGFSTWITPEFNEIVLEPEEEEQSIKFTLDIPADATPGLYVGGISAANKPLTDSTAVKGTGGIVGNKYTKNIRLYIPGERITRYVLNSYSVEITDEKKLKFEIEFKNEGNNLLALDGEILIKDSKDNTLHTIPIDEVKLYQQEPIYLKYSWDDLTLFTQDYQTELSINVMDYDFSTDEFNQIDTIQLTNQISYTNWSLFFIIALIVLATLLTIIIHLYFHKLIIKNSIRHRVAENETIDELAEKYKVKWHKIAGLNHIHPPYDLETNLIILIPAQKRPKNNN